MYDAGGSPRGVLDCSRKGDSEGVGQQLRRGVVQVGVVEGATRGGKHHVGVARELRHLATAPLRFPDDKLVVKIFGYGKINKIQNIISFPKGGRLGVRIKRFIYTSMSLLATLD